MRSFLLVAFVGACTQPDPIVARELPAAIQADAATVVAASNTFAIDVLHKQRAGNAIFSPFSIATALAMLDAGAAGQTDTEIRAALHETLSSDQLAAVYAALLASLQTGRDYDNYSLDIVDQLFGQKGYPFLASFLATTKNDYQAELAPVDFATAPDAARNAINNWVASETGNRIGELFPPGSIDDLAVLVLANAIHFKGNWDIPFDASNTKPGTFHVAGSGDVTTPLMYAERELSMDGILGGRIGVFPFHGKDLAMVILLPDDPDGLPQLEAQLTGGTIADHVAAAYTGCGEGMVVLPKFTLTENEDLTALLESLGITSAFSQDNADFSGVDGARDLYLQTGFHDAAITVDETGAEADAASGESGVKIVCAGPSFIVDHSFDFAIYDNVTHSILFLGRVQDPTAL